MKAPYSYRDWVNKEYGGIERTPDIAPELLYDGYVYSLETLGYEVYGNCYDGIIVEEEEK